MIQDDEPKTEVEGETPATETNGDTQPAEGETPATEEATPEAA